jgi:hypothetical protein
VTAAPQATLTSAHFEQLEGARRRAVKVRRAAAVSAFNAWTTALFAACALLSGIFSMPALLLGIAMAIVAAIEFRAGARLRRFDLRAPLLLGWNQLLLLAAVTLYCLWQLLGPQPARESSGSAEVDAMLADYATLEAKLRLALYAAVIAGTVLAQGLTAIYYFTRARHIRDYLAATPQWVVQIERVAA